MERTPMPDAYTEDTVELVARALFDAEYRSCEEPTWEALTKYDRDSYRKVVRIQLDVLAERGLLLPEGADSGIEYAVRFISSGGSHMAGAERQQHAHALASQYSRLPGCRAEVLRVRSWLVEEVEANYPSRSPIPPEPKEGAGGQPSPA
jgi:hypothetical protein